MRERCLVPSVTNVASWCQARGFTASLWIHGLLGLRVHRSRAARSTGRQSQAIPRRPRASGPLSARPIDRRKCKLARSACDDRRSSPHARRPRSILPASSSFRPLCSPCSGPRQRGRERYEGSGHSVVSGRKKQPHEANATSGMRTSPGKSLIVLSAPVTMPSLRGRTKLLRKVPISSASCDTSKPMAFSTRVPSTSSHGRFSRSSTLRTSFSVAVPGMA
jgi:hypothetical protein